MTRRRAFLLGMALVVAGWFLVPTMCRPPQTPEGRVRAAIQAVADGVGEGDIVAALAPVSRAYADQDGADFTMVRGLLWREIRNRGPITVTLGPIEVALDEDGASAEASFVALLMDGLNVMALDIHADNADAWHFTVQLRLEDDDEWRIVSHQRRGVQPQDVFL
jgi:hypothetical protein